MVRTCCNLAGFVPTMDLGETSVEVSQTYASSYEHGFNLTMTKTVTWLLGWSKRGVERDLLIYYWNSVIWTGPTMVSGQKCSFVHDAKYTLHFDSYLGMCFLSPSLEGEGINWFLRVSCLHQHLHWHHTHLCVRFLPDKLTDSYQTNVCTYD